MLLMLSLKAGLALDYIGTELLILSGAYKT
jgi:hypothetical protein